MGGIRPIPTQTPTGVGASLCWSCTAVRRRCQLTGPGNRQPSRDVCPQRLVLLCNFLQWKEPGFLAKWLVLGPGHGAEQEGPRRPCSAQLFQLPGAVWPPIPLASVPQAGSGVHADAGVARGRCPARAEVLVGSQSLGRVPRAEATFPHCPLTRPLSGFGVATVQSV